MYSTIKLTAKIRFTAFRRFDDSLDLSVEVEDLSSPNITSFSHYRDLAEIIEGYSYSEEDFLGIALSDLDEENVYEADAKIDIESTSFQSDYNDHYEENITINITKYNKSGEIESGDDTISGSILNPSFNWTNEKGEQLKIRAISSNKFYIEIWHNCIIHKKIINVDSFKEFLILHFQEIQTKKIKEMIFKGK